MTHRLQKASGWVLRIGVIAAIAGSLSLLYGRDKKAPSPALPVKNKDVNDKRIVLSARDLARLQDPRLEGARIASLLNIEKPMRYGEFLWNDDGVPAGQVWIRVDLSKQIMSVFRGGDEIGTAVIMYGADEKPTPIGRFSVLSRKEDHRSSLYDADMPYTLRLTGDGVSIHGADVRAQAATHGCVSIPTEFARLLFTQVRVGDSVFILPEMPRANQST